MLPPLIKGFTLGASLIIAIGSQNASHFHPGMGTLFLTHLGELLGMLLALHSKKIGIMTPADRDSD